MSRGNHMIDMAPFILRSRLQNEVTWKSHDRHQQNEVTRHVNDHFKFLIKYNQPKFEIINSRRIKRRMNEL